jgi:hypothetical protein
MKKYLKVIKLILWVLISISIFSPEDIIAQESASYDLYIVNRFSTRRPIQIEPGKRIKIKFLHSGIKIRGQLSGIYENYFYVDNRQVYIDQIEYIQCQNISRIISGPILTIVCIPVIYGSGYMSALIVADYSPYGIILTVPIFTVGVYGAFSGLKMVISGKKYKMYKKYGIITEKVY